MEIDELNTLYGGRPPPEALARNGIRPEDVTPLDLMTDSPGHLPTGTFRHAGGNGTEDQLFIWYTNDKGQRVRLDGPFANDIEAARALREMRQSGLDPNAQVEIAPDFDPRP